MKRKLSRNEWFFIIFGAAILIAILFRFGELSQKIADAFVNWYG